MNPDSLVKVEMKTRVLGNVCEDLGITEWWVEKQESLEESDERGNVRGEEELEQIIIGDETLDHDGEEHDAVANCIGGFERWGQGRQKEREHLHG